jgi:hypothetical protein
MNAGKYGDVQAVSDKAASTALSLLKDRTYLQQIDTIMRVVDGEIPLSEAAAKIAAGAVVPGEVRGAARALDPAQRQKWNEGGGPVDGTSFGQKLDYTLVPSAGNAPTVKLDMWGNPMAKDGSSQFKTGAGDTLFRLLNPLDVREAKTPNNLERMLYNYYRAKPTEHMPTNPDDTFRWQGAEYRMTPEEYAQRMKIRGAIILQRAGRQPWNFDNPSEGDDIRRFKDVLREANDKSSDLIIAQRLKTQRARMLDERTRQIGDRARRIRD